jgi:hypothetical protein
LVLRSLSTTHFFDAFIPASASRLGLQSGPLHTESSIAEGGGTLFADHVTGETGQNWRYAHQTCSLCYVSVSQGRRVHNIVPENPDLDG